MVRINRRLRYKGHIKGGHILCGLVTLLCLWFTVSRFSNAIPRLILAFRDLGVSVAYFFTVPYGIEGITPTVTELPTFGNGGTVPAGSAAGGVEQRENKICSVLENVHQRRSVQRLLGKRGVIPAAFGAVSHAVGLPGARFNLCL